MWPVYLGLRRMAPAGVGVEALGDGVAAELVLDAPCEDRAHGAGLVVVEGQAALGLALAGLERHRVRYAHRGVA
jgi:hypothetical protein